MLSSYLDAAKKKARPCHARTGGPEGRRRDPLRRREIQNVFLIPTLICRGSTTRLLRPATPSGGSPGRRVS